MRARRRASVLVDQRVGVAVALAVLVGVVTARSSIVFDDAYILFRYARNVADGYGWTFNPGFHTADAATSPLMVLLLAGLTFAGLSMLAASGLLFALGMWSAGWFTFLALREQRPAPAVVAGVLVVTAPPLWWLRGMESAVSLGLIAAALWAFTTRRDKTLGVAVGLAVLARPDNMLLAVVVLGALVWQRRRMPWAALTAGAVVLVPWVVFSAVWLGEIFPATLAAKQAQHAGGYMGWLGVLLKLPYRSGSELWFPAVLLLAGAGLWLGRKVAAVRLVAVLAVVYSAAYIALGVASYFWYYAVPLYAVCLLAAMTVQVSRPIRLAVPAALLVVAVGVGLTDVTTMGHNRDGYWPVSAWLKVHAGPSDLVATEEIGVIGYQADVRIFDYMGLLDPAAVPHLRRGDLAWWAEQVQPRFFVGHVEPPWPSDRQLHRDPWFVGHYRPVFTAGDSVVYELQADPG